MIEHVLIDLDEAAQIISKRLGCSFSVRNLLQAAERGEIAIGLKCRDGYVGWLTKAYIEEFKELEHKKAELGNVNVVDLIDDIELAKKYNTPGNLGCDPAAPLAGIEIVSEYTGLHELLTTKAEICSYIERQHEIIFLPEELPSDSSLNGWVKKAQKATEVICKEELPNSSPPLTKHDGRNLNPAGKYKSQKILQCYMAVYNELVEIKEKRADKTNTTEAARILLLRHQREGSIHTILQDKEKKDLVKAVGTIAKGNGYRWPI